MKKKRQLKVEEGRDGNDTSLGEGLKSGQGEVKEGRGSEEELRREREAWKRENIEITRVEKRG